MVATWRRRSRSSTGLHKGYPGATLVFVSLREPTPAVHRSGDHTVKVTVVATGKVLHSLAGHRRTPWVVSACKSNPDRLCSLQPLPDAFALKYSIFTWHDWQPVSDDC